MYTDLNILQLAQGNLSMIQTLSELLSYGEFNGLLEVTPTFSLPDSRQILDLHDRYNIDHRKELMAVYVNFASLNILETMHKKRSMLAEAWKIIQGVTDA